MKIFLIVGKKKLNRLSYPQFENHELEVNTFAKIVDKTTLHYIKHRIIAGNHKITIIDRYNDLYDNLRLAKELELLLDQFSAVGVIDNNSNARNEYVKNGITIIPRNIILPQDNHCFRTFRIEENLCFKL